MVKTEILYKTLRSLGVPTILSKTILLVIFFIISSFLIKWIINNIKAIFNIKEKGKKKRKKILSEYEQTYGAAKVKEFIGEQKYNKIKNN
jgi:triacylglycerol esterase/lipase EstA (alpha/beta hydrolase family)